MKQGKSAGVSETAREAGREKSKKLTPEPSKEQEIQSGPPPENFLTDVLEKGSRLFSWLDESIRSAIPFRRFKWWVEAKLSKKEFSTYLRLQDLLQSKNPENAEPKWGAWLVLVFIAAGPLFWTFQWQKDRVYQSRIAAAVNEEPGIEILGLKNYLFRKNRILLLRDPMAKNIVEVFDSARVPISWREIDERGFISLEEPFSSFREREAKRKEAEVQDHFRAEIAALYREIEKLSALTAKKEDHISLIKSEFFRKYPIQKTADLVWIEGNHWELVGTAVDPYYSQIAAKTKDLIIGGGTVSLEKFIKDVPEELKTLRTEISQLVITYREPELRITYEGLRTRSVIIEKLAQLLLVHDSYRMPPPKIELHATPVEGASRGQDISLASARVRAESAAIRNSSVGPHVEITTFLDSVPTPGRSGVYLLVK